MRLVSETELNRYLSGDFKRVTNCVDTMYLMQQAKLGKLYLEEQEKGVIFLVEKKLFYSLYYCLTEPVSLQLPTMSKEIFCEVFGRDENAGEEVLGVSGFEQYASYCRMGRKGAEREPEEEIIANPAQKKTLEIIKNTFDCYSDCLPEENEEVLFLNENYEISINEKNVLIYDVKNSVSTLKYICVDILERQKGMGTYLLKEYIRRTSGKARRYLLWVKEQNIAAQKLYDKFGYCTDGFKKIVWKKA